MSCLHEPLKSEPKKAIDMTRILVVAELQEHLKYEIDMINGCYRLLMNQEKSLAKIQLDVFNKWIIEMSLKDGFATHARCLLEFFHKETQNSAAAFTQNTYEVIARPNNFLKALNNQVAHLIYEREIAAQNKIEGNFRSDVMKFLRDEVLRFRLHLKKEYSDAQFPDVDQYINVTDVAGPSSQFDLVSNSVRTMNLSITGPIPR